MKVFSGIQPSGAVHIGNYFGALKQWADMSRKEECIYCLVDYHALTSVRDPALIRTYTTEALKDLIAIGIDPDRSVLFKQSDVSEHTELAWIFNCLITVPFLMQAHAYKDKVAKGLEANAGLFTYPALMAADILLYDTDIVPVGKDQQQHVEYAREIAAKFNAAYGQTFKEPHEKILETVAVVPGTDGKKMSKSYGNTIPLFASKDEIKSAVMGIVTDSGGDIPVNVYNIHKLFKNDSDLAALYEANKGNYKASKEALIEDIELIVSPMRERRANISDSDVARILQEGSDKARTQASAKITDVKRKIGVAL
jgi:tryptophanyl-tRNA synthetase